MIFWKKKDNLVILGFVALFFVGLAYWSDLCCGVRAAFPGQVLSASQVSFVDKNQIPHTLDQFKGKPLIINFWATWCPVCVKKMGTLNTFAQKFRAKGGEVISLSEDSSLGVVTAYFARHGYQNLQIYLDAGGQLMNAFGASGLPTSIFIDAQGKELGRISGGIDWESAPVHDMVDQYFGIHITP
jgi:thiol-disulfide isomerase/thioredoxin